MADADALCTIRPRRDRRQRSRAPFFGGWPAQPACGEVDARRPKHELSKAVQGGHLEHVLVARIAQQRRQCLLDIDRAPPKGADDATQISKVVERVAARAHARARARVCRRDNACRTWVSTFPSQGELLAQVPGTEELLQRYMNALHLDVGELTCALEGLGRKSHPTRTSGGQFDSVCLWGVRVDELTGPKK